MKDYGNDWIITVSNSENVEIFFYRFVGTEDKVKDILYLMADKKAHELDETYLDLISYPDDQSDIEYDPETGALYCSVANDDIDYVFTAKKFCNIGHIVYELER
ncbi:hypothetical protein IMM1_31270 [Pseudocoprococcus immobilis]